MGRTRGLWAASEVEHHIQGCHPGPATDLRRGDGSSPCGSEGLLAESIAMCRSHRCLVIDRKRQLLGHAHFALGLVMLRPAFPMGDAHARNMLHARSVLSRRLWARPKTTMCDLKVRGGGQRGTELAFTPSPGAHPATGPPAALL